MTVTVATARNLTQDAVELLNVVMDIVMVMKPKHHVQKIEHQVDHVKIVNLIGLLMDLNVAIQLGMSLESTVLTWKPPITGIAPVVHVLVILAVILVALQVVTAMLVMYRIVLMLIAAQSLGLVMALQIVKIRLMAVT